MKRKILAVDVVILPSKKVSNLAISLNQQLKDSPFILNKSDFLPHITLVQGYINNLEKVKTAIAQVATKFSPFRVVIEKLGIGPKTSEDWGEYYFYYLEAKRDLAIFDLHKMLVEVIPTPEVSNPTTVSFVAQPGEEIVKGARDCVAQFKLKYAGENYRPHITLGGELQPESEIIVPNLPIEFVADKIALCQLGNFCTCRKILGRWKLEGT